MGLLIGATLSAHHSFSAEFDANKPLKLTGTVTKMEWINPHSFIRLDVKDPKTGEVQNWGVEMAAPNALLRRGFNKNSLPAGTVVVVDGFAAKDGKPNMNGTDLTFPDGRKMFLGSSGTGAPYENRPEAQ